MNNIKLTVDEVEHIAKLANLTLSAKEEAKLTSQLTQIVELISQLGKVVTKDVKETSQVTGLTNILREDKIQVERVLTQAQVLSNAKRSHNGYFVVDRIV